ncbi:metal-dependent hydrolase family protein [Amycolatopsis jiangsuensis]|uniref:Imidazolonepropionase-like amidohydrolase n=1 Tax=Amycolatopsis jiangsuensis TaxID=1181879 RepID=A0A840IRI4_9PSEU|nr:amidohydrolase family protein [Amycolatopsis jiangsuensis]MBB4683778.1 imidazolonepropionase-like amidohydrolase [Amycolatopsis jiangsuensis]
MSTTLFRDAAIFDGINPGLRPGHVLVEDGVIREISDRPIAGADTTVAVGGRTLMPGLIDLHVHIWAADLDVTRLAQQPTEYYSLFAARFLQTSLDHGFTTLRDAGGTDAGYARAIERDWLAAPRFFHSGRYISQTGGHGDFRAGSQQDLTGCECCPPRHERFTAIADGADAVRRAVREEFRRGARAIKIMASGGVASPSDPIDALQFTDDEIRAAVDEATMRGSYVFAHCHPDAAIRRASELGVRCIEHATFLTPETAEVLARNGTFAVPTLAVVKALEDDGLALGLPEASRRKLAGTYDAMLHALSLLNAAGVKTGFGTDLLGAHHVRQGIEFELRAEVLDPHDILLSATSVAAEILQQEGRLGVIAPGAHADLLVVDGDPLTDIGVLGRQGATLPVIMKAGRFHKNEL